MASETSARPSWQTPRDLKCPTYGPAVGRVAARLRQPLMPWQQEAADIMGEVEPSGRMRYPLCVLIVPRRAGKTALTLSTSLQRAASGKRRRVWYTAQTGGDAGDTMVNEWFPLLEGTPYERSTVPRLSNGSQGLSIPSTGSRIGIFPPTRKALHGKDSDYVTVDEAWSFTDEDGLTLEAAIRPTMLTRLTRQLVIVSAGGDADSTWLLRLRELGRKVVDEGSSRASGVCFIEYSPRHVVGDDGGWQLDPDLDLEDPQVWAAVHPAIGHTIDLDALRQDRQTMGADMFQRMALNVFSTVGADAVIPADEWKACADPEVAVTGRVRLAYDVADDLSWSAVTVSSRLPDGRVAVELADYRPGLDWLPDVVARMRMEHRASLHAVADGPATTVTAKLRTMGIDVAELSRAEYATACVDLLADVKVGALAHRSQPALNVAVTGAARSIRGDLWSWVRRRSDVEISPLVAATVSAAAARPGVGAAAQIRHGGMAGAVSSRA